MSDVEQVAELAPAPELETTAVTPEPVVETPPPTKRGRPAGSTNKSKQTTTEQKPLTVDEKIERAKQQRGKRTNAGKTVTQEVPKPTTVEVKNLDVEGMTKPGEATDIETGETKGKGKGRKGGRGKGQINLAYGGYIPDYSMAYGGGYNNPGFKALPAYVQENIMRRSNKAMYGMGMAEGGQMPQWLAQRRFAAAGNQDKMSSYGYENGGVVEVTPEVVAEEVVADEVVEVAPEVVAEEVVEVTEEKVAREITVDVTEDVAALTNGEDLSEEFKTKAATIFEAAVITRVKAEVSKLQEEFDNQLAEQVEEIKEGLVEKVDGYLNYVVEQWIAQNEIALESGMKSEILESFVQGLKGVFEEHYIDVPEEKFDVLGDMQEKLEQLESKLDETVATNVDLTKQINEQKRIASVIDAGDGLADTDVEKFKGLAEELSYEDADSFKKKLQTIRENYFTNKSTSLVESVVTDSPVITEEFKAVDPMMKSYLSVLNSIKK